MTQLDAAGFNRRLHEQTTPADCGKLFLEAVTPLGFDTFACGEIDLLVRERSTFHIIAWPDSWRDFYFASGLIDRDPIVDEVARRSGSFTWSDLRADRRLPRVGSEALDKIAEAGWNEGFALSQPRSSGRIGVVSLAGHRNCQDPDERDYLTLIATCLQSHVRTLIGRCGFAIPPAGLTARELECLQHVARGKSDAVIGREMGIAASTAHEFVEKAKRRMQVRTRIELAALAAALGIADV